MDKIIKLDSVSQFNADRVLETLHPLVTVLDQSKSKLLFPARFISGLYGLLPLILPTILNSFIFWYSVSAQGKNQVLRMAKLVIDSAQLINYKATLKEGIETTIRVEPGILSHQS
jgi:hypothetical protein